MDIATLKLVAHFVSFGSDHSANVDDGIGLVVFDQENEGMIHVEEFGIPQLVGTKDGGVVGVSIHIELHGRGVEDVGQVEVLLPRDVGQVRLLLVHSLGQTQLSQVFLQKQEKVVLNLALPLRISVSVNHVPGCCG